MANPRPKQFATVHRDAILKALGACRSVCTDRMRHMPLGANGDVYRATEAFLNALDDYVGVLIGNRQHFWLDSAPAFSKGKPPANG